MQIWQQLLRVPGRGAGMQEITAQVAACVTESGVQTGTCHVFCQHTSASLVLMENADPSAQHDLEAWLDRLVPADDPHFTHTYEGPDDMPSHIKMALTRTSETLPIHAGRLALGTWQGLFLWEHRTRPMTRSLMVTIQGT